MTPQPTYKGRPAADLSRDELIEAYTAVVTALERERAWAIQALEMDRELEDTRRLLRKARLLCERQ